MIKDELINCTVEALILASPEPVSLRKISEVMGGVPAARVRQAVSDLNNLYMGCGNSFRIREVAGGYQVHILPDFERVIKSLLSKERTVRLTRAALETLAIVAYKQPVTKIDIEHIRGVSSDGVLHNLLERKLIVISGRAETPGRPLLYKTSNEFLKFFGLNRLSDLPRLEEIEEMIREAEPSRDQTEMQFGEPSFDIKGVIEIDADEGGMEDDVDEDMIAHVRTDADVPPAGNASDESDREDDNSDEPGDADVEPDPEAGNDPGHRPELSLDDGGNGNGSSARGPELDEDSATAVDLVFGEGSVVDVENRLSTILYLPAGDESTPEERDEPAAESSDEPSEANSADSEDRRVTDE